MWIPLHYNEGWEGFLKLPHRRIDETLPAFVALADTNMLAIGSCVVKQHLKPLLEIDYFRDKVGHPCYLCFEPCINKLDKKILTGSWHERTSSASLDENEEFSIEAHKARLANHRPDRQQEPIGLQRTILEVRTRQRHEHSRRF